MLYYQTNYYIIKKTNEMKTNLKCCIKKNIDIDFMNVFPNVSLQLNIIKSLFWSPVYYISYPFVYAFEMYM